MSEVNLISSSISNPYFWSLITGLVYGFAYCGFLCVPYLVTYIAGVERGFRKGVATTLTFGLGRVAAYVSLGVLVGVFGGFLSNPLYQKHTPIVFGIAIVVIGVSMFLKKTSPSCIGVEKHRPLQTLEYLTESLDVRAFLMGFTRGLIPCAPLIAILLYSATLYSMADSIAIACLFGLGTMISPLLLIGGVTGWLTGLTREKAPLYTGWMSKICGGILILIGINVLLNPVVAGIL